MPVSYEFRLRVTVLSALALFALVGCRSSSAPLSTDTSVPKPSPTTATDSTLLYAIDPTTVPPDTKITLSRTICYGTCPAYKLEIFANGRVVFEGQHHVRRTGQVVWQIDQDRIKQLIAEFAKIKYFSLADDYSLSNRRNCPNFGTDAPSVTTSITINGQTKTVFHSHGCQDLDVLSQLESFEDKIDEIADAKRRIG